MVMYPGWVRSIGRVLERFPAVRTLAKRIYQRSVYLWHKQPGVTVRAIPGVRVMPLHIWSRIQQDIEAACFFGYYDVSPWSADMRRAVLHIVCGDKLEITVLDRDRGRLQVIGATVAWNYQQGSRAQWLPGSSDWIVFNDVVNSVLGSWVVSVDGSDRRFIPWPIQSLHPKGRYALTLNYKRLYALRREYGYSCEVRNFTSKQDLEKDGIWIVDMENGHGSLLISLLQLARCVPVRTMETPAHKVNHIIYSPSGSRFVFMHRWFSRGVKYSRLYVAQADGTDLRLLMDEGIVSHYHWVDDDHLVVWGRTVTYGDGYHLIDLQSGRLSPLWGDEINQFGDGHPSFSPGGRWMITDTYPDRARQRHLLLWDRLSGRVTRVATFFAPWRFDGEKRCDLHPRWSPDGRLISVDSAHEGIRCSYVVDVSTLVEEGVTRDTGD